MARESLGNPALNHNKNAYKQREFINVVYTAAKLTKENDDNEGTHNALRREQLA